MERKYLIKTIKAALPKANQRPLDEAAEIIADMIGMAEEILMDIPMPIKGSPEGAGAVLAAPITVEKGEQSPPVVPPSPTGTFIPTRVYREPQELMSAVNEGMPAYIELRANGKDPIQAPRVVTALQAQDGGYFGVQVSYTIPGSQSSPKTAFWVTQEDLSFPVVANSLREQAEKIFNFQPKVAVNRQKPPTPGAMKGAETDPNS